MAQLGPPHSPASRAPVSSHLFCLVLQSQVHHHPTPLSALGGPTLRNISSLLTPASRHPSFFESLTCLLACIARGWRGQAQMPPCLWAMCWVHSTDHFHSWPTFCRAIQGLTHPAPELLVVGAHGCKHTFSIRIAPRWGHWGWPPSQTPPHAAPWGQTL